MSKRAPSAPPLINGFEYVSLIGSGGFSDVFLYQQQRPRRRVAVKVLLHEWSSESQRASFDAEADLMATLSTHPSIVTMYEANIADDGRPYLAMEYCSRANLGARYRTERLSVAESLRIAVQIAGAVETAHRAGILHRDIKPANILVTEYGHPALTDFGISSTMDDVTRAEGMSIPWSPPESFAEPAWSGVATDVWALAATLYTFLAGRSPFEVPGGSNSSANLISRIESSPLAATGRSDVPASLERVLGTAMAKVPASRYPTMLAFARALQQVQNELSLATTPIDLLDDSGLVQEEEPDDDSGTRLREIVSIDPRGPGASGRVQGAAPSHARPDASTSGVQQIPVPYIPAEPTTSGRGVAVPEAGRAGTYPTSALTPSAWAQPGSPPQPARSAGYAVPVEDTVHRAPDGAGQAPVADAVAPERRRVWPAIIAGVVLVGVVGGAFALLNQGGGTPDDETTETTDGTDGTDDGGPLPGDAIGDLVPPVTDLAGTYDPAAETVTFTWKAPDAVDGDEYAWALIDPLAEPKLILIGKPTVAVPAQPGQTCIEVVMVRDGTPSAEPQKTCVETEAK